MTERAPVIRRRNLEQAGLAEGLAYADMTRAIIGDTVDGGGLPGRIYVEPALPPVADKAAALQAAAVRGGAIGSRLHAWGLAHVGDLPMPNGFESQRMFTRVLPLNDANAATLDPFFHRVQVPYGEGRQLTLEYQHATSLQGYVAKITDSAVPALSAGRGRANSTGVAMYKGKKKKQRANDYDQQHVKDVHTSLLGLTATEPTTPRGKDAYTKLAGEGARFVCVRNNMSKLQDNSRFYCSIPNDDANVHTVTLAKLWVSWQSVFSKAYDIPNATVANELRARKAFGTTTPRASLNAAIDVDLGV
jgi:hypothetical protein